MRELKNDYERCLEKQMSEMMLNHTRKVTKNPLSLKSYLKIQACAY